MKRLRPILIFGTRPEAIKMAPVVAACRDRADEVEPIVCSTGQHREMLDQVTDYFGIAPDFHLRLMRTDQTLAFKFRAREHKRHRRRREGDPHLKTGQILRARQKDRHRRFGKSRTQLDCG